MTVNDILQAMVGQQVPGGCDECDTPHQEIEQIEPGVFVIHVYHDDGCPFLSRLQGQEQ